VGVSARGSFGNILAVVIFVALPAQLDRLGVQA